MSRPTIRLNDGFDSTTPHLRDAVRELQTRLCAAGYGLVSDGLFGNDTQSAVQRLQRDSGLDADGIAGPMTWGALVTRTGEAVPVPPSGTADRPVLKKLDGFQDRTPHLREPVRKLQELLNRNGAALDPDGLYGSNTDAAVRAFQQKHDITEWGVAGPKTWAALERASAVTKEQALKLAEVAAAAEGWRWAKPVSVLDKGTAWKVSAGGGSADIVVVSIEKATGKVVQKQMMARK